MLKIDKIDQVLNDFLAPFDCSCICDINFAYYTQYNLITYAFAVPDVASEQFLQHVENLYPEIHADLFLWSFLHELGHHETEDDFEQEEWDNYKEAIRHPISNEDYFNLAIEDAATRWAGDFIQTHVEEVAKLWEELAAAIKELYTSLNITP